LRSETISIVSETGGHLGAGLGVVELTTAIHAVFDTPKDDDIPEPTKRSEPKAEPKAKEAAPKATTGDVSLDDLVDDWS